jgi:hypothetical protein
MFIVKRKRYFNFKSPIKRQEGAETLPYKIKRFEPFAFFASSFPLRPHVNAKCALNAAFGPCSAKEITFAF